MGLYIKSWCGFGWGVLGFKICAMEITGLLSKTKGGGYVTIWLEKKLSYFPFNHFKFSLQPRVFFALLHAAWW